MWSKLVISLCAIFLLLGMLPERGYGWGAEGHRIVCEIAWQRLTPAARQLVGDLLRGEPDPVFARSCTWADEVRGTTHRHTAAYHYINIPAGADRTDLQRDCGDAERRCVTWAIHHYARRLADRSLSPQERNEALKFVAHFVGDLHQPLHAGRPEDLGGNRVTVNFFGDAGTAERPLNLHSVWDSGILRRAELSWPESAQMLDAQISPVDAQRWESLDLIGWTDESFRIADQYAYGALPRDGIIANGYYRPALGFSEVQLQKAGVRLAFLLNQVAAGTLRLPELGI
ncbi:MAG: S1/P1 nuclease [Gemmatimonadota bacterium]|nr:S1/P1 nuclease [Gemmatimonadota bacterium]